MKFNTPKIAAVFAIFILFFLGAKPTLSQNQQENITLDNLSIEELEMLYKQKEDQDQILIENCYASSLMESSCDLQAQVYKMYLYNLRTYIDQRKILGY
mgnify:FL=1